ncbi:helix-turn-helix domain-containing protein [Methylosarcina fibrata]|uniref:helix-turn-helix domain-containing protein n=1 Tax=Methylosarcina fibrata TaxID=105972 RepID=UPI001E3DB7A2|nr:helix-turn-helix domain-containing protein [Methylosarcina fibrata]
MVKTIWKRFDAWTVDAFQVLKPIIVSASQEVRLRYAIEYLDTAKEHHLARVELMEIESDCLRAVIKKSSDWRERERAETVLLLASGKTVKEVAEQQNLCREAVRIRRRKWLKRGLASLPDQPRSGAPTKLTNEHRQQLGQWVEAEALSSRELLTRLAEQYQVHIGPTTLRTELKLLGYVWKRTRYSLKKKARSRTLRTSPTRD